MEESRNNYRGEWSGLWNRIARYVAGMGYTRNKGTVTGILMNGVSKGNAGNIDLGSVQEKIDADHKLSADLIEDGQTNKVINVKPDWNAASGTDTEILNKPTIPSVPSNIVTGISSSYTIWVGTQAQYEAIATKDAATIYLITGS